MRNLLLVLLISMNAMLSYGQQGEYIYHEVAAGETVYSISKKYDISKAELEKYNPDIKGGLKEKMMLLIPKKPASKAAKGGQKKFTSHKVEQGQTLYSIAQKYDVLVEDIKKVNPELKDGLKAGQVLLIPLLPKKPEEPKPEVNSNYREHKVEAGETLYSLALKYGVSVEEIKKINTELAEGLKAGEILYIPKEVPKNNEASSEDKARLAAEIAKAKSERKNQLPAGSKEYSEITSGDYHIHKVEAGQTAYSISKQYHISLDSLYILNPGADEGLRLGQLLKLPLNRAQYSTQNLIKNAQPKEELASDNSREEGAITDTSGGFFLYQLKTGDSYYSLKNRFNVSSEELMSLNPELKEGLNVDKYIIIPKRKKEVDTGWLDKVFSDVENSDPVGKPSDIKVSQKESLNREGKPVATDTSFRKPVSPKNLAMDRPIKVGVMLPFMAGTDTTFDYDSEVPARSHYVLDFYNGLLLAADTMSKQGMNLSLQVYDTQNSLFTVREKMNEVERADYDMMIGPLFQKNVEYVADELKAKGTPVVSPLSKAVDLADRPNLVKCVPGNDAGAQEIADLLNAYYKDAKIVFTHSNSMEDREKVRQIKARLTARTEISFMESVVSTEGLIKRVSLTDVLAQDKPNVVVVFSEDKVFLSDLVTKLRSMRTLEIALVGPPKLLQIPTLEMDYLNTLKLTMTDASFVDYGDSATIQFIKEYRKRYGSEPSQMSFQGYDVAMYFLNQLWLNGPEMLRGMEYNKRMLSTGFRLSKTTNGGYENQFVHITGIRDFTLVKLNVSPKNQTSAQSVKLD